MCASVRVEITSPVFAVKIWMERFKWEACGARLFQPATDLTSPPSSCLLLTGYDTRCLSASLLCEAEPRQREVSVIHGLSCPLEGSHMCSPKLSARSGRNYRFSEPEVNAIHLHQREGLQRGFLPDLGLHAVADVSGPNHLEAQRLAPRRRDEGAPQVDAVADELRGDDRPGRQRREGGLKNTDRGGGEDYFIGCNIEKETSRRPLLTFASAVDFYFTWWAESGPQIWSH